MAVWLASDDIDSIKSACPWAREIECNACCEYCPFKNCLLNLRAPDREKVLQGNTILKAYKLIDKGIRRVDILEKLGITIDQLNQWRKEKNTIITMLKEYGLRTKFDREEDKYC